MAIFQYKGITKTGKEVKATVKADGVAQAKQKLRAQGVMITSIKEQKAKNQKESTFSFSSGVSVGDLSIMTRQLATLVRAKIQIVEALGALTDQIDNPQLKIILAETRGKVNEGMSLAKALSAYPKVFNNVYVNMVEAGEASGTLEIVLLRLADFTEAQVKLKNKISGAMMYPSLMTIMGSGMMFFMFVYVVPKLAKLFTARKMELPLPTKICLGISSFLLQYWWAVAIGAFVAFVIFRKYIASKGGKYRWHKIQLKLPIVGILVKMINVSRFCSTLATLLNSGVPILVALNIVKNLMPNVLMQESVEKSRTAVQEGASIALPLKESGHFPNLVTHMITLGEKSGELEDMLKIVAENYEEQVDARIGGLTAVLEPIMMIGMGLAVGFVVLSVIVPMMSLNTVR